jgi:molecular chaperone DnaK
VFTKLVERNTTIPTTKKEIFSTADDNQKAVTVRVFQGERPMASDNRLLAQFDLVDIQLAPRGMPKIEVSFDIDKNGILNVTARDEKTGKEVKRQIEQSSGLSNDEVEKMRKDAERFADDDKKKKEFAEEKNKADTLVWEVEKAIREAGDKMPSNDKAALESAVAKVKEARDGHDVNALRNAVNNLQTAAHAMAQQASRGAGQTPPGGPSPDGGKPGDDVIDAEFEVKK